MRFGAGFFFGAPALVLRAGFLGVGGCFLSIYIHSSLVRALLMGVDVRGHRCAPPAPETAVVVITQVVWGRTH